LLLLTLFSSTDNPVRSPFQGIPWMPLTITSYFFTKAILGASVPVPVEEEILKGLAKMPVCIARASKSSISFYDMGGSGQCFFNCLSAYFFGTSRVCFSPSPFCSQLSSVPFCSLRSVVIPLA
jgi:hypothetical protein